MTRLIMLALPLLVLSGCLNTGCEKIIDAVAYPSIADVKEFARMERATMAQHGRDMADQHRAMAPDAADAITSSSEAFKADLVRIGEETDAIHGTVFALANELLVRFAGLPPGESIAKWTSDEEANRGVSTDSLIGLAVMGLGATAAGGTLARSGKSRSHTEIEAIKVTLGEMKEATALGKTPPAAGS